MAKTTKQAKPQTKLSAKKVVIVHKRALLEKYGAAGYAKVKSALDAMVRQDRLAGIGTRIALVDSLVPIGGIMATVPSKAGKFKAAVDSIYNKAGKPDYLLLLGGPDVIPHISLRSPWGAEIPSLEDDVVDSDLPYASNHRHTLDASKFLDAPRSVGRIPDVPGSKNATYLINRIQEAMNAPTLKTKDHFSLSADVWKGASTAIITQLFGAGEKLYLSPPQGPAFATAIIKKPFQYINCHGDTRKAEFYGEKAGVRGKTPLALNTAALAKNVVPGAVVVAECCYGAELFQPQLPDEPQGMALSYLEEGAGTFLGSSTISYGGATATDLACADELCLFFLEGIFAGATCGVALADARRRLVQNQAVIDNYQIKTLAQFMLLGDPARQPVKVAAAKVAKKSAAARSEKGLRMLGDLEGPRDTPIRKAPGSVPVANQSVAVNQGRLLQSIPMPKGVAFTAKLFASSSTVPPSSGLQVKGLARKSLLGPRRAGSAEKPSVLVVSIPNDPQVIAAMRQAWDQAEKRPARTVRALAPKAAVATLSAPTRRELDLLAGSGARMAASMAVPTPRLRELLGSVAVAKRMAAPPRRALAKRALPPANGEIGEPERNRHVALVARIANGQIQTYKVIVAR